MAMPRPAGEVAERFGVTVDERTIGKWLRKLNSTCYQRRGFISEPPG